MSQELNLGNCKLTFGEANGEATFTSDEEHSTEVVDVGGQILAEDENVVYVDEAERKIR